MANLKPRTVWYRRRREQKTDYHKRLHLLLSRKPKLVIRFTNRKIIAQLIIFEPKGDKALVAVDSSSLIKFGWNYSLKNFPAAYLTGLLIGKLAQENNCSEAILDSGAKVMNSQDKTCAFLKGVVDSGLNVPFGDEEMFPDSEKINGKIIQDYAEKLMKDDRKKYELKFSQYLKSNQDPSKMVQSFEKTKDKIMKEKIGNTLNKKTTKK